MFCLDVQELGSVSLKSLSFVFYSGICVGKCGLFAFGLCVYCTGGHEVGRVGNVICDEIDDARCCDIPINLSTAQMCRACLLLIRTMIQSAYDDGLDPCSRSLAARYSRHSPSGSNIIDGKGDSPCRARNSFIRSAIRYKSLSHDTCERSNLRIVALAPHLVRSLLLLQSSPAP